jgi:pimeloyl-ACP methyl ester carboxylesterase
VDSFHRGDLTFPVLDHGPADGAPVVLLHGFPQDATAWSGVTPLLVDAGLRTLAPDQRGYAATARPRGRRAYTLDQLSLDVVTLLDSAGLEKAHVVGHDWGGVVAWHLASRHSDRVATLTVLSTPHPAAYVWSLRHSTQAVTSSYMAFFQVPKVPELVLRHRLEDFYVRSGLPRETAQRYAPRFSERGALTGPLSWYRALPLTRTRTGRSRVPTTYVWGRHDPALGRAAAARTSHYVTVDYRFLEVEAGHWLPETHPGLVASEVLRRVEGE